MFQPIIIGDKAFSFKSHLIHLRVTRIYCLSIVSQSWCIKILNKHSNVVMTASKWRHLANGQEQLPAWHTDRQTNSLTEAHATKSSKVRISCIRCGLKQEAELRSSTAEFRVIQSLYTQLQKDTERLSESGRLSRCRWWRRMMNQSAADCMPTSPLSLVVDMKRERATTVRRDWERDGQRQMHFESHNAA